MRPGFHPDSAFRRMQAGRLNSTPDLALTSGDNGEPPYPLSERRYISSEPQFDNTSHSELYVNTRGDSARYGNDQVVHAPYSPYRPDQFDNDRQFGTGQDQNFPALGSHHAGTTDAYRHAGYTRQQWSNDERYHQDTSGDHDSTSHVVTPGADNFSSVASGGMAGLAYSVAERNARESDVRSTRTLEREGLGPGSDGISTGRMTPSATPPYRSDCQIPLQNELHAQSPQYRRQGLGHLENHSYSSMTPLRTAAALPPRSTPDSQSLGRNSFYGDLPPSVFRDDPYQGLSRISQTHLGVFDPDDIDDDGDDGLDFGRSQRRSMLSLGSDHGSKVGGVAVTTAGATGATAGLAHSRIPGPTAGGQYDHIGRSSPYKAVAGLPTSQLDRAIEKPRRKRVVKWGIIVTVVVLILGAIAGALLGSGVFKTSGGNTNKPSDQTAGQDSHNNGDLDVSSPEIQALMNNPNLHKVFLGIDYTPLSTQYPDCLKWPPSPNNVTRDLALLSQLTNTIRLYGTDCNQTEMVLHAIDRLQLNNTMKVWLGVWQDNNVTTNARQLVQMYNILETYGQSPFRGVIVANEILFREQMTSTQLAQLLTEVKANLTAMNMDLPVATSDLGTTWDSIINEASDLVMANIHPFFSGTPFEDAASWTWNFWSANDAQWWRTDKSKNVIAETGWPTAGGTDCGIDGVTGCSHGAVASTTGLNQFLEDWVCQALANGTQYFWFEAFDEPWKVKYDTPGAAWEDQWGMIDVNRNLKPGIKIPDCGGATVP